MTGRSSIAEHAQRTILNGSFLVASRLIRRLPGRVQLLAGGGNPITIDGNTLDPAVQLILAGQHAVGFNTLSVLGDPAATRARARQVCRPFGGPAVAVQTTDLVIDGPAGPIGARHYRAARDDAALLVYFHGGGYVFGDLETHDPVCRLLCRDADVHVLAVDYRLAPEHKAPAAVDDAYAAYLWALAHSGELGARPGRVAIGGDSAGGGLAATVCQLARDAGAPAPILQLLLYPYLAIDVPSRSRTLFSDGFLLTEADLTWFASQYVDMPVDDPRVSPLLANDLSNLPPAVVVTAGFDPLRDQGRSYVTKLRAAGSSADLLEFGSMMHGFANFPALGGGVIDAVGQVSAALRSRV
ncbi:MAG: alpha/beta hydrolase [Mycobacterium sp.]